MGNPLRVLLVEDSAEDAFILMRELRRGGYDATHKQVESAEAFQTALSANSWDLVIADWHLPKFSAPAALAILKKSGIDLPFLILSGVVGEAEAIAAMKAGAHDYIQKGNTARLLPAIERELREADLRRRNKRLEEALQQSQKMELIGRFAGQVATQFKEALVTITNSAAALSESLPRSESVRQELEHIEEAAQRAGMLTFQLLALGQTEPARAKLLDLNVLLTDNYEVLRHIVGNQVRLTTCFDPALASIRGDQSQIEQLVLNLVVNARDATPPGGSISIETTNAELDAGYLSEYLGASPGKYVLLSIRDTGSGIPRQVRPHIFEPFFSTKPKGRGTGMGLAFVYNIVKQSGGDIQVESEPGRGSVFKIYFPQAESGANKQSARMEASVSEKRRTILVVESDPDISAPVQAALTEAGHVVLNARDGRTARLIARSFRDGIDLLLASVVLPDMSGSELAAELAGLHPEMKVVYSAAYGDPCDVLLGGGQLAIDKRAGADGIVRRLTEVLDSLVTSTSRS